jgi:hypothetical protein
MDTLLNHISIINASSFPSSSAVSLAVVAVLLINNISYLKQMPKLDATVQWNSCCWCAVDVDHKKGQKSENVRQFLSRKKVSQICCFPKIQVMGASKSKKLSYFSRA